MRLQQFRSKVASEDPAKSGHAHFVDPGADVVMTTAPEFESTEYENGITTVKGLKFVYTFYKRVYIHTYLLYSGYSTLLRKRYNSLATGSSQLKRRAEEARQRRAEFDVCLETLLLRLQELEGRSSEVMEGKDRVSDKLENLRVSVCILLNTALYISATIFRNDTIKIELHNIGHSEGV